MKLGNYAHISISVRSLRESAPFYDKIGFTKVWSSKAPQPWELLTDGSVNIHLYESYFSSPALHYFSAAMDDKIMHLRRLGFNTELHCSKDGTRKQHNFLDPNEVSIMLMHHDGEQMPKPNGVSQSLLGTFGELSINTDNLKASLLFWDKLGFRQTMTSERPYSWSILTDGVITIGLHQTAILSAPALSYFAANVAERLEQLERNSIPIMHELRNESGVIEGAILCAPDRQLFALLQGS